MYIHYIFYICFLEVEALLYDNFVPCKGVHSKMSN
jgi:hypothetical protein